MATNSRNVAIISDDVTISAHDAADSAEDIRKKGKVGRTTSENYCNNTKAHFFEQKRPLFSRL